MAFATAEEVATRQGRTLTDAETAAVTALLDYATAAIADAALKDDAWASALDPVPTILKGLCIELVGRALANYEGLTSTSQTLGAWSQSKSFNKEASTAFVLTETERKVVRRTVGNLNYSVRTPTATEAYLESLVS